MTNRSWRALRALLELDAKEYLRDWGALFFSFAFPLFFVIVLAVQSGRGPAPTRVGVVAGAGAPAADAERLISLLGRDGVLVPELVAAEEGLAALRKGDLKALMVVPAAGLRDGAEVRIRVDPRYAAMMRTAFDSARLALAAERAPGFVAPFAVTLDIETALRQDDLTFVFPGLLALALLQLGLFGTATPLLRARDRGTLRHLSTTPAPRLGLLVSQLTVRLGISMLQMALLVGCALVLLPDLHLSTGQWIGLVPATLGGAAMLIALGYALAGLPSSHNGGMLLTLAVNFVFLFGGAIFFDPGQSTAASVVAYAVPLTYLSDLFRQLLVGGAGLLPVWIDALAVVGFTVLAAALALKTFRFEMAR
jgi:ABC-2 type transport system permease protein